MNRIVVVGAGLSGCEVAWQLAKYNIPVVLFEMKPKKFSKAHKSENFCELVCSNSLKSEKEGTASYMLKQDLLVGMNRLKKSARNAKTQCLKKRAKQKKYIVLLKDVLNLNE